MQQLQLNISPSQTLSINVYSPQDDAHANIICLHGTGEYSGCYETLAQLFTTESYRFIIFDLPGHGRSSGKRGHARLKNLLHCLTSIIQWTQQNFPSTDTYLLGYSLGAQLGLRFTMDPEATALKAMIACAPWLQLVHKQPIHKRLTVATLSWLYPSLQLKTGVRADQLSPQTDKLKRTSNDPFIHKFISIGLFHDMRKSADYILQHPNQVKIPTLILHGDKDMITSYDASKQWAEKAEQVDFIGLPNQYHSLLQGDNQTNMVALISQWIKNLPTL